MRKFLQFFTLGVLMMFPLLVLQAQTNPVQGDIVINTFDHDYNSDGGTVKKSYVVIVNRSETNTFWLNGHEVISFDNTGAATSFRYQWTNDEFIEPGQFILICTGNGASVNGVDADYDINIISGGMLSDGYTAFRKQRNFDFQRVPGDYIDLIKHSNGDAPNFTGVPAGSGVNINNFNYVDVDQSTESESSTRGGVSGDPGSLTYSGYYIASDFTVETESEASDNIQNSNSGTLPVELVSFISNIIGNTIKLNWSTVTEQNNKEFVVERKLFNEENWTVAGRVNGNGTTNTTSSYSFEDKNLKSGTYNYRLKQTDFNGNFEYYRLSSEVVISSPKGFDVSKNYPNPCNPMTKVDYTLPVDGFVSMKIYDNMGREVMNLINQTQASGYYSVDINASTLSSGVYYYRLNVKGNDGQTYDKTMKMTLIK